MLKGVDTLTIYLFSTRRKSGDEYQKSRVVVWELGHMIFFKENEFYFFDAFIFCSATNHIT